VLSRNPDTVFIEFGINDAYEPFHISVETCRSRLENMIDVILKHNPDCEIILLTTNAVAGKPAEVRPHLEDYYQVYRDVAKERSLLLVDMYPLWQKLLQDDRATYDRYVRDGLHPGALGCEKVITPAILDAMGF
jgi:lysophospholipase L1-like esterase